MKNNQLTPTQVKLKNVLRPIVEGILKEEEDYGTPPSSRKQFANVKVIIFDEEVAINIGKSGITMNPAIAKQVCQYILSNLKG